MLVTSGKDEEFQQRNGNSKNKSQTELSEWNSVMSEGSSVTGLTSSLDTAEKRFMKLKAIQ